MVDYEVLVEQTVAGDGAAWQTLWSEAEPLLLRVVGNPRFLGRLSRREDDRKNIVLEVMARLSADDFARLRGFVASRRDNPQLRFATWLRVVAKRVGIDYLRGHDHYLDRRREPGASSPGKWVEPGTLPSASKLGAARPPITDLGTAAELLRYAADRLDPAQHRALALWVQSASYEDIAREVELASARDAEKVVRAAIECLRRKFRA
jgi:DNA-directed RNA polymerase specialized sigma24 family protein